MVFGSHERILAMDGDYIHVRLGFFYTYSDGEEEESVADYYL